VFGDGCTYVGERRGAFVGQRVEGDPACAMSPSVYARRFGGHRGVRGRSGFADGGH
jgi:hypothetical protein